MSQDANDFLIRVFTASGAIYTLAGGMVQRAGPSGFTDRAGPWREFARAALQEGLPLVIEWPEGTALLPGTTERDAVPATVTSTIRRVECTPLSRPEETRVH